MPLPGDPVLSMHETGGGARCSLFFIHYFCCSLKFSHNFWGALPRVEIVNTLEKKNLLVGIFTKLQAFVI